MKRFNIFTHQQTSILSAAMLIMVMIVASRVLGLVRQRVLADFFNPGQLSIFFAAFRLPDTIFEVLVYGTFSSAFIPVFTHLIKDDEKDAWRLASSVANIGLIIFVVAAIIVGLLASPLYSLLAPGYSVAQRAEIVSLTRLLFAAQGFFVVSYVLTGVLESSRRFLVPALAPIFYNLGIIIGTSLLFGRFGLMAPVIGVFIGAIMHFVVQIPLAYKLGFRFSPKIFIDENVKKIGRLALPRVVEIMFQEAQEIAELFFSSFLTVGAYAYYTFGNTLQLLPVGLLGTSIAKAALPSLTRLSDDRDQFIKVVRKTLFEMTFLITPLAAFLMVLRIPIVRLVYGTDIFTWEATVQTGMVVSAFAFGIVSQAAAALLARSFYALHDTKTPVTISICSLVFSIVLDFIFVRLFHTPVWGLAAGFSLGSLVQTTVLYYLIHRRMAQDHILRNLWPFIKQLLAAVMSGGLMFFVLKFFDRSVWIKKLSFLGQIEIVKNIPFEKFVLDTRYTTNLLILTVVVTILGSLIYLLLAFIFKIHELYTFSNMLKRMVIKEPPLNDTGPHV